MTMLANNTITRLTARVKELEGALTALYSAANKVSSRGCEPGSQWVELTSAILKAYVALNPDRAAITQPTERTADE